jgi:chemotaxis protein MotD
VDITAIVQAVTADSGDAKVSKTDTGKPAATTDQATDGSKDTDAVAADTKTADVAAAVIVAVATPAPVPAVPVTTDLTADPAAVAPAGIQATAPAIPADAASPDAPVVPATTPEIANPTDAAAGKPQTASDAAVAASTEKTAPSDDAQKAAALKAAGLAETIETPDAKSPALADRKADSGKAKSDRPVAVAHTTDAQPRSDAAKSATAATTDQQPKAVLHQPHEPSAEHASVAARAAATEARPELPATAAAPAQLNAATPAVPFNLVAPLSMPLASMPPLVALHVDPGADNPVPVAGLAVEIVSRAQDGLKRFDIRLDPPELGRIDVRLDVDNGGKVTSRLVVERAETLDLLRRDAPQLERALQHAGLNTEGGLEFSLRDQNFANREQTPRDLPTTHLIVPDDEPAAAEAARRGYGRLIGLGGGVDIRV